MAHPACLLLIIHSEQANDPRIVWSNFLMSTTFDKSGSTIRSEVFSAFFLVNLPPLFKDSSSGGSKLSGFGVDKFTCWNFFLNGNLPRSDDVSLLEVQLAQHHSVHCLINLSVVGKLELDMFRCEP